jgi:hypothetical protein
MANIDPSDAMNFAAVAAAIWAGVKSTRADRQTRSTGNGFAQSVKSRLSALQQDVSELKATGARTEAKVDTHIADHAVASLRKD